MKRLFILLSVLLSFAMPLLAQNSGNTDGNELIADDGKRFVIPVIFHVLYNNADEDIKNERLLEILQSLQNDFLAVNVDIAQVPDEFKDKIGKPNVKFVLAELIPPGSSTAGIIRQTTKEGEFNRKKNKMFKESPIIEPAKYLNIYICDINTGAYYPNSTLDALDGIVIDYKNANAESRTATHEVGHWLDLYHIYGYNDDDCETDYVDDTPTQKQHWFSCPTNTGNECGSKSVMVMNFMDYSKCRYFFTKGQVERMRQYLLKEKPLLRRE